MYVTKNISDLYYASEKVEEKGINGKGELGDSQIVAIEFVDKMEQPMNAVTLVPMAAEQLALCLQSSSSHLLILDIRPNGQFCSGHIQRSENLNFSSILLRRLLKGVVRLETMLTSPELVERVCKRRLTTQLVLYDAGSTSSHYRPELLKHAEVFANCLKERDNKEGVQHSYSVHFIDGGYPVFSRGYPELCEESSSTPNSHVQISVSSSLPVSLTSSSSRQRKLTLQSAPADDTDRYGPPVELLPYLTLGCAKDSSNLSVLQQLGVTAVLNVSHNCPSLFPTHFQYMEIRVPDTYQADLLSRLDEAFSFIDAVREKGGKVLVHCHAGVSRSATVCMAYIMKTKGHDLRTAYDFVKRKRSCVSPNLHFMGQLLEFEKQLGLQENSETTTSLSSTLTCLEEEEEERERPCSLPPSWVSKEKRRAVSTPASLEMSIAPYTIPSRRSPLLSPCRSTPTHSTSLPATPLPPHVPLPGPLTHSPLLHQSPLTTHLTHSCSFQSLTLTTATPRPVTESL